MDLELKHLGQTLAIGGLAVVSVVTLLLAWRPSLVPRAVTQGADKLPMAMGAVCLALVFAAGIVLEDVSKERVSRADLDDLLTRILNDRLGSNDELRFACLFAHPREAKDPDQYVATDLLIKTLAIREPAYASPYFNGLRSLVEKAARAGKGGPRIDGSNRTAIDGSVRNVFYAAKNRVIREDRYYEEISDISERLDFIRSLFMLCMFSATVYALFLVASYVPYVRARLAATGEDRGRIAFLLLLFVLGALICPRVYRSEAINYNQRVFGYYASLLGDPPPDAGK